MTQKDVLEGGQDPLRLDPDWPGLDAGATLHYEVGKMRSVARELRRAFSGEDGGGQGLDQHKQRLLDECQLSEAHIGTWHDASAFTKTVGANSAGTKFVQAYADFAEAFDRVIKAIEANADIYARTNQHNEGGREA
ncbi:hypothetical protein ACGF0J_01360 [Nonomuraea sp. NPDC047897]|jgi:hypothetical protein|uniref:hypothetical protein n=1 Tax=Nonomuraea sp. NPDC047897 TaxID=3364346 RepID=UPI003720AEAA